MQQKKLTISFITLLVFYLMIYVAYEIYPFINFEQIKKLDFSWLNAFYSYLNLSINNSYILIAVLSSFALGVGSVAIFFNRKREKKEQIKNGDDYFDIHCTLGKIPKPEWIVERNEKINLTFSEEIDKIFSTFSDVHQNLFKELFQVLAAHPETFVGAGHKGSLLEHTIHVLNQAVKSKARSIHDPLAFIAIAAHDIGKIISNDKSRQDLFWVSHGYHDEFSGLILSTLPSYHRLSLEDERILTALIKYNHKPSKAPIFSDPVIRARVESLMSLLKDSDKIATKEEKEDLLAEMSIPDIFERIFWRAIENLRFMEQNTPAGIQVDAFAFGENRGSMLLVENKFREKLLMEMTPDERAVFNEGKRNNNEISKITLELIKWLKAKGLLVTEFENKKTKSGLWNIKSGQLSIKGVIFFNLPENKLDLKGPVPRYEVSIEGGTNIFHKTEKKTKAQTEKVKESVSPRKRVNKKKEDEKSSDKPSNKPNEAINGSPSKKKMESSKKTGQDSPEPNRPIERKNRLTQEERKKKYKKEPKEKLEVVKALNKLEEQKKKMEEENAKRIKLAEERLKDKKLCYEDARAELDFLVAQKRLEVNSPYYIAILERAKQNGGVKDVKKKKEMRTKQHMQMITASIM